MTTGSVQRRDEAPPDPLGRDVTLIDKAVSAGLWTAGLAWMVPMMGTMMAVNSVVPADRTEWLSRLYCWGQVRLTGARVTTLVDPAVDPGRPYLFACNHVNLLDHVTMYNATPHFKQGMELAEHFDIPVYGWFMRQRGTIPVHRGRGPEVVDQLREHMRAEIDKGHSILVFPEGTRTRDGRVRRFKKGVFGIARDLELPIVPTSVTGMFEVLRAGSRLFRPGREVTVYCDAPVDPTGWPDDKLAQLALKVREQVMDRVDAHWEDVHGRRG